MNFSNFTVDSTLLLFLHVSDEIALYVGCVVYFIVCLIYTADIAPTKESVDISHKVNELVY